MSRVRCLNPSWFYPGRFRPTAVDVSDDDHQCAYRAASSGHTGSMPLTFDEDAVQNPSVLRR
jgi:hypothetical protein